MAEPIVGKVKWFNPEKGFGFIAQEDPAKRDIFVHISSVEAVGLRVLYEGQEVTYKIEEANGKESARINAPAVENEVLSLGETITLEPLESPINIEVIQNCTEELVRYLQSDPKRLYRIHPAAFEELIANIFESDGFTVEFNKAWNQADGGVDIIAVRKTDLVPITTVIQCKRYSQSNRVTAEPIRSLSGVLDRYRAHAGVLATTSYFTGPAIEEARTHMWRIKLQDYEDISNRLMQLYK